ncbi:MAG: haloacid dehalogenase type II [Candidatus Nephthysia bennettiae]|uniref:Haloacid dehalogenase type II n=1 Tax=Candidatus Nephthysia bennettiae TaxID=3127016 RepID=A0A934KAK6_9BACT|nr:haloacid dehalogenase type II [Candidatus Dormibacteraeota bacterium]MBJ7611372.1 haloacid dehalogenase type II [Candidatus Dormibacteraeota bacterium]PZR91842.1 MAG: haloacid dehalogenase type II [Candidatus Dormibacteraeota bacterium]
MKWVCVFDVNETLLDLGALDPRFEEVLGDASLRQAWFQQMLQSAMVSVITDAYCDFGTIGRAALRMVAARRGLELSEERATFVVSGIRELPPHPEVPGALRGLAEAGFRLAALTNSTREVAEAQLQHAGLAPLFEQILTADSVRRLKPAREPYLMAAERLEVTPKEVLLVAAHSWDVAGAMRAGCSAAFVARPGMVLDPLAPEPQVVGEDLGAVAGAVIRG